MMRAATILLVLGIVLLCLSAGDFILRPENTGGRRAWLITAAVFLAVAAWTFWSQ